MKTAFTLFTLSFLFSFSVWSQPQEKFLFAGYDLEPYYFKDPDSLQIQGAIYEIMQHICRRERLECEFFIAPYKTVLNQIENGHVHMAGPFIQNNQIENHSHFTDKLFSTGYSFYGLQKNIAGIKTYDELFGLGVGVFSSSTTSISLEKFAGILGRKIQIIPEQDLHLSLKKASKDIYPLAYSNRDVAKAWVARHKSPLHEVVGLGENVDFRLILSKKSISPELLARIQKRIAILKKENTLQKIAGKFRLQLTSELQAKNNDMDTIIR